MKPMGRIPPGFGQQDSILTIGGHKVTDLIARAGGTPLFVYDLDLIRARVAALRAALPADVALHYAVKANPLAPLVTAVARMVDGLDIASAGEMAIALASGTAPEAISFAGPGKRDADLRAAVAAGVTLNIESAGEAHRALSLARSLGVRLRCAIRVNPDFDLRGSGMKMGGGAKPFGVDAAEVPDLIRELIAEGAIWLGLHIYAGSQALDAEAIIDAQRHTVALAARIAAQVGAPAHVNLGGGFGLPYFANEQPLDLARVGAGLGAVLAQRDPLLADTKFCIELGRYLVGEAGVYLTQIVDRKVSHGETFLVTDGGLHHQLAASGNFGTVVRRNYPLSIATRADAAADEVVSVVGCLCTPLDRLGDMVHLPRADVGDIVAIYLAGAYGASASPAQFLGHGPALELVINDEMAG